MKNGIERQIKAGYGDLRRSEKKAADYILEHMEQAAEMSIDCLAKEAQVSQLQCCACSMLWDSQDIRTSDTVLYQSWQ